MNFGLLDENRKYLNMKHEDEWHRSDARDQRGLTAM